MIQKTIRFASYLLVLFGFGVAEGCSDDDDDKKEEDVCYRCFNATYSDNLCYSDFKDDYTLEEFEEQYIATIDEQDGWTCELQD